MDFSRKLLKWYNPNKRDLPWRNTKDPYKVWLSEIILQQTRVDQGMSYYLKFVKLYPNVHKLAVAKEDKVLKAWQGLGYYSRARNLHYTAKYISKDLNGQFPDNQVALSKLKGIGAYTSAAIASFCFNEKVAVVDGNVIRVLTRIFGIEEPADSAKGKSIIQKLADELIDPNHPGEYNQAIMEFGAIHCTVHHPSCDTCPFANNCFAKKEYKTRLLPVKGKKTAVKNIWLYYFFLQYKGKTYLRKRSGDGIWKGLFDFPGIETEKALSHNEIVSNYLKVYPGHPQIVITDISHEFIHVLSHRKIHALFFTARITKKWTPRPENIIEVKISEIDEFGIPRLIDKFLEKDTFAGR